MQYSPGSANRRSTVQPVAVSDYHAAAATVSQKQLERLRSVYDGSVFDTSGPNADVLKLLLTTCKTLLSHAIEHTQKVHGIESQQKFLHSIEEKVNTAAGAAAAMSESVRRVNFLWAAQGLSDFALNESHIHSNAGSVVERAASDTATADVLRKSYETMALADERVKSFSSRAENSELAERISTVEKVVEGVHGVCCKVQAESIRLSELTSNLALEFQALEQRFAVNVESLRHVEEISGENVKLIGKHIDGFSRKLTELSDNVGTLQRHQETLIQRHESLESTARALQSEKATTSDIKAAVASSLATTTKPINSAVENLYKLLDIPPAEAQRVCGGPGDHPSVMAADDTNAASAAEAAKQRLRLVHSGVPFRSVLSAIRFLGDSVQATHDKVEVLTVAARSTQRPLIGLELADVGDSVAVTRVFEDMAAKHAGVKDGDVVIAAHGRKLHCREDFQTALEAALLEKAASMALLVDRGGHILQLALSLSHSSSGSARR